MRKNICIGGNYLKLGKEIFKNIRWNSILFLYRLGRVFFFLFRVYRVLGKLFGKIVF